MTTEEARSELRRVFVAYPSYRQWLEAMEGGRETMNAWCEMLTGCDIVDVQAVVSRIVSGDIEPVGRYDKPDALPRRIREEAISRRSQRVAKAQQVSKYHTSMEKLRDNDGKFAYAHHEAIRLGTLVRDGELSKSENDRRMAVLSDWAFRCGPKPDWEGAL